MIVSQGRKRDAKPTYPTTVCLACVPGTPLKKGGTQDRKKK